ncbi:hypothetical protein C4D60_Mb10t22000 [Musa balbisiana]|uniref:CCT domain-containing protein n=1 Tax=Musa balbisiana TaxID=52838 RepID=A0A4S8IYY3_MUSBA|nr:hypothetical protein C4D60_Mb10t22000 [Musa balbisiana]
MGREKGEEEEDEGRRGGNERGCGGDAGGHQFLDRSKVRILLCDNDPKSSQEVLQLLYKCSYQVTSVKSAKRVIDVLNAQGSEIDIILAEVELPMAKDPSDVNTSSTILISDNTDDQLNMVENPELNMSNQPECESNVSPVGPACNNDLDDAQYIPRNNDRAVIASGIVSLPKKIEFKVGRSSAFLTYVNSNAPSKIPHLAIDTNSAPSKSLNYEGSPLAGGNMEGYNNKLVQENYTSGNGSVTRENIYNTKDLETLPECPLPYPSSSTEQNEGTDVSGVPPVFSFPFYYPGVVNQNIMSSPGQMFQGSLNDVQAHPTPAMLPQYAVVPYMPLMPSFPCQPLGTNPQSSHMAAPSMWPSMTSSSTPEVKSGRTERRAAALVKFRQKRKERCFDKKIRYVKRKRLAEKRPRVRGQFVKQVDNVDLSYDISSGDGDSEDDEADEPTSRELELISSSEQNASY